MVKMEKPTDFARLVQDFLTAWRGGMFQDRTARPAGITLQICAPGRIAAQTIAAALFTLAAPASAAEHVKFASTRSLSNAPFLIAEAKGYFGRPTAKRAGSPVLPYPRRVRRDNQYLFAERIGERQKQHKYLG